ncbi:hypothetical protein [Aestuariivirga sp.]|uniref:phage adaptor protein n=1 Tax=Aestuariivirga sp. TaxID=2650926 RepID=UPI0039E6DC7F
MAMSFTTLMGDKSTEGSIKYYVRHSEVPSASILESAQGYIYSKLRTREMKKLLAGVTIASGDTAIALPADFQDPISLWLDRDYKQALSILDEEHFEERVDRDSSGNLYQGTPCQCTMDATTIYLDVAADQTYYYRMWYYATPAALSVSNETNWLTARYPQLLEAICKAYAYRHREDDASADKWLQIGVATIEDANAQYDQFQQTIRQEAYWSRP